MSPQAVEAVRKEALKPIPELRAIASAATPGPWRRSNGGLGVLSDAYEASGFVCRIERITPVQDAEYIATFNPSTCLELLARLEAMEAQLGSISYTVNGWNNGNRSAETAMHAIAGTLESTP